MANAMDRALESQLRNLQARSGKTLEQLYAVIRNSGLRKHGAIRDMLKRDHGMGHGDANVVTTVFLRSEEGGASGGRPETLDQALDAIYSGTRASLRPIHEELLRAIATFGEFEIAPKKAYVSLRRKKQFATVGPATKSRVDVGLNMKGVAATPRLVELPAGQMCQYRVQLTNVREINEELVGWIRRAFDSAG